MSGDGPILAWLPIHEVEKSSETLPTHDECIVERLISILRGKLGLLSFRFSSLNDARNAFNNCRKDESGKPDPEGIKPILHFIPADGLVLVEIQLDDSRIRGRLTIYIDDASPIVLESETSQRDFLEGMNELAFNLAGHFMSFDDPKFIRSHLERYYTTNHYEALVHFANAHFYWKRKDFEAAQLEIRKSCKIDTRFATPLGFLAKMCREAGKLEEELVVVQEEADLHLTDENPYRYAESMMRLGHAYAFSSRWDEAIAIYQDCEKRWQELSETRLAVQARSNCANVFLRQGRVDEAISEYRHSLDTLGEEARDRGQLLYNLSLALGQNSDFHAALEVLEQALFSAKKRQDYRLICRIYNARGAVYDELEGEYLDLALQQYRLAEEYFTDEDQQTLLAGIKDHIAITYRKLGRFEEALKYSEQACNLLANIDHQETHLAIARLNRASLLSDLGQRAEAKALAFQAFEVFKETNSPHLEIAERFLESLTDDYGQN